jgi:carbonic anhydrase
MTILGHSGCGGWAIVISETDEVIFLKRCDKYILNTGSQNILIRILYAD